MPPVKNPYETTSYGGIIRIRLRVEVGLLPLSLLHKLPCFILLIPVYTLREKDASIICTFQ